MYARINDSGALDIFRKKYVVIGDTLTVNPTAEVMRLAGYKPLVTTPMPEVGKGQTLTVEYRDTGDTIESVYSIIGGIK